MAYEKKGRGNPAWAKTEKFSDREEGVEYLFILSSKSNNPPLKGGTGYPLRYNLLSEIAVNTDNGEKLIRHVTTEKTIWADEQSEGAGDKKTKLTFIDGYLRVEANKKRTLEFLRAYPEGTFYEFDENKGMKDSIAIDEVVTKAKGIIYDMSENDHEGYMALAKAVNIDTNQKASFILHDMLVTFKNPVNARQLLKDLNGKTLIKTKSAVQTLIEEKVISVKANTVKDKAGEVIFTCDMNTDVVEAFTEHVHNKKPKLLEELKAKIKKPLEA